MKTNRLHEEEKKCSVEFIKMCDHATLAYIYMTLLLIYRFMIVSINSRLIIMQIQE